QGEQVVDLFVGSLAEVVVPESHGVEGLGSHGADHLVYQPADILARFGGCRRDGYHESCGALLAQCLDRGAHGGSGGESIVHEDHRLSSDLGRRSPAAVATLTPLELDTLLRGHRVELGVCDAEGPDRFLVDDPYSPAGD